jgi:hypothetical protein
MGDTKKKAKAGKAAKSTKVTKSEKAKQKQAVLAGIGSSAGQKRVLNPKRNRGFHSKNKKK